MNVQNKPVINFEHDATLVSQLLTDLQQEQTALISADVNQIEKLIDKRIRLLQALSLAAKNRYDALAAHGFEANEKGMESWLKAQAKTALNQTWMHFQKSLIQAKEMNRLNGILINKHHNRNQQMLGQLQGHQGKTDIYSKYGQAKSQSYLRGALTV